MIDVSSKKRIVLKLGTSTLTHKTGKLNIRRMTNLVRIFSDLHNAGKELLLVSSGAVGMGLIAALMETDEYRDMRDAIGLDRFSQVLLFSTEGNTDPMKFRKVLWDGEYPTA